MSHLSTLPWADAAAPIESSPETTPALTLALHALGRGAALVAATAALLFGGPAAHADEILRFPASDDPAVFSAQKTLVEAWSIVEETYVDERFNNRNWGEELGSALVAAYTSPDGKSAYGQIGSMLEKLGDPYTRIVPPQEYADFRVSSDGEVQGVGLLIATDPSNGHLVVLAPIRGGPADRAGILPGDEVLSIDGRSTQGWDGEQAAKFLRGRCGSSVSVRFARRSEQIPGVAGKPESAPKVQSLQVQLQRERLELSPVYSTAMAHGGHTLGYIRLVNFSQHAAQDVKEAIDSLEHSGAEGMILDLRNNPGGLVRASLDIARLWMKGEPTIFNVQGRHPEGMAMDRVVLSGGVSMTDKPLVVLVNSNSASASEILAGALHDNRRAVLIGDTTFGKGKIQSVFELDDGSALFVTVAKYKTPLLHDIDRVGIKPDRGCGIVLDDSQDLSPGALLGRLPEDGSVGLQLQQDNCILTAELMLEGKM